MKRDISIALIILVVIAFLIRVEGVKTSHPLTYDEKVYPQLAVQISKDPANYNTIGIYQKELESSGRKLPAYFTKPLFKHPPLFPQIINLSFRVFGSTYYAAFKVSILCGVLLIILAYFLGGKLFDKRVALYSALLMAIEPISWISSQKIWMETTLAFFIVLSIYFFVCVLMKYNPYLMAASGISAGLAGLTKYPGMLALIGILVYALCFERWLFKKKSFILSLIIQINLGPGG